MLHTFIFTTLSLVFVQNRVPAWSFSTTAKEAKMTHVRISAVPLTGSVFLGKSPHILVSTCYFVCMGVCVNEWRIMLICFLQFYFEDSNIQAYKSAKPQEVRRDPLSVKLDSFLLFPSMSNPLYKCINLE